MVLGLGACLPTVEREESGADEDQARSGVNQDCAGSDTDDAVSDTDDDADCDNGIDGGGDGWTDHADPDCSTAYEEEWGEPT